MCQFNFNDAACARVAGRPGGVDARTSMACVRLAARKPVRHATHELVHHAARKPVRHATHEPVRHTTHEPVRHAMIS